MSLNEYLIPGWLNVSRETHARLEDYYRLVVKWNKAINLVSAGSLKDGWQRHVLDSAQMLAISGCEQGRWLDIGSGAGFPGLVVAILADETLPDLKVTLVEGDRRKAAFLSEAIRQLKLGAEVFSGRVENLPEAHAAVVSARAFAPLHRLLAEASRHLSGDGVGLFMKGQTYQAEIAEASDRWAYECDVIPSKTDANSVVLRVRRVRHVES